MYNKYVLGKVDQPPIEVMADWGTITDSVLGFFSMKVRKDIGFLAFSPFLILERSISNIDHDMDYKLGLGYVELYM